MVRPMVLIPHLFRLADAIIFRKDYLPPLVRHLDLTVDELGFHRSFAAAKPLLALVGRSNHDGGVVGPWEEEEASGRREEEEERAACAGRLA